MSKRHINAQPSEADKFRDPVESISDRICSHLNQVIDYLLLISYFSLILFLKAQFSPHAAHRLALCQKKRHHHRTTRQYQLMLRYQPNNIYSQQRF